MSRNDIVYVKKQDEKYHVWYGDFEDNAPRPSGNYHKDFDLRQDALLYAHDIDKKIKTQYGVREIEYDHIEPVRDLLRILLAIIQHIWLNVETWETEIGDYRGIKDSSINLPYYIEQLKELEKSLDV